MPVLYTWAAIRSLDGFSWSSMIGMGENMFPLGVFVASGVLQVLVELIELVYITWNSSRLPYCDMPMTEGVCIFCCLSKYKCSSRVSHIREKKKKKETVANRLNQEASLPIADFVIDPYIYCMGWAHELSRSQVSLHLYWFSKRIETNGSCQQIVKIGLQLLLVLFSNVFNYFHGADKILAIAPTPPCVWPL